jgi:hypothetical protein
MPIAVVGEVRNVAVDFTELLDSGESLTGTPTVTEITTTDLTFANVAVNTAILTIYGVSVAVGKAVQFKVSGQLAGVTYKIKLSATTDATPAQTIIRKVKFPTKAAT